RSIQRGHHLGCDHRQENNREDKYWQEVDESREQSLRSSGIYQVHLYRHGLLPFFRCNVRGVLTVLAVTSCIRERGEYFTRILPKNPSGSCIFWVCAMTSSQYFRTCSSVGSSCEKFAASARCARDCTGLDSAGNPSASTVALSRRVAPL